MSWCGLVFACAFVIPMLQLVVWFWQRGRFDLDERYAGLIVHTLYLGGMAALITVSVALLLAFARRLAPTGRSVPASAWPTSATPCPVRCWRCRSCWPSVTWIASW